MNPDIASGGPVSGGVVDDALLERVRNRLAGAEGAATPAVVAQAVRAEAHGVIGDADMLRALRELETELVGAGRLEPLLADPSVTDVLVNGPDDIWVDGAGGLRRVPVRFPDEAAVRRLAQRLALAAGRRLDDAQPWVDGRIAGSELGADAVRLHALLAPIARGGTAVSLRVLRPAVEGLDELAGRGAIAPEALRLLRRIVAARLSFLVAGGTGAGKTTLLSALLAEVDASQRIVCVEDAPELSPAHPHVVNLVARPANAEGAGAVSVRDLVRQALRMRPDRIVVGEVRGAEVMDMLTALNTGHEGGACTVHANAPHEVPARLEALAAAGGGGAAQSGRTGPSGDATHLGYALHSQLGAAVDAILHVRRRADGKRRLEQIAVLRSADGRCEAVPAWTLGEGFHAAAHDLYSMLDAREDRA